MIKLHEYEPHKTTAAMFAASRGHGTRKDEFLVHFDHTLNAHSAQEIPTKTCTKCGETKPATIEYFASDSRNKSGLGARCKLCRAEDQRAYESANKEQIAKRMRTYCAANKERKRAYDATRKEQYRAYYAANREQRLTYEAHRRSDMLRREYMKEWRANHPEQKDKIRSWTVANREKTKAYAIRRRARIQQASGTHTGADIKRQHEAQKGKCYYCQSKVGDSYHVDHVIPLSRGGSNGPENIVIACPSCNLSKNNKLPHEWVEGGRLL